MASIPESALHDIQQSTNGMANTQQLSCIWKAISKALVIRTAIKVQPRN